jgi:stage II sporulation protein AA (anti-sigma F factor antagonist)
MIVEVQTSSNVTLAKIKGDLDHHTAKFIRSEIDREISEKHPKLLVIDFSGVTFMDSSGIGLIMGRYKLMQDFDGSVTVAAPPNYIKKVIRLAGIDKLAPIADNLKSVLPKDFGNETAPEKFPEKNSHEFENKETENEEIKTHAD